MMNIHLVDAFADRPFTGNPAAVCLLSAPREESWMQQLAFELGYSETAFVNLSREKVGLRWFTPTVEVALCGHATLASAHVLWGVGRAKGPITFETKSGELTCERRGDQIWMDFPKTRLNEEPPPVGLLSSLEVAKPVSILRAGADYLVELSDEAAVRDVSPDHRALAKLGIRGVMVTARSKAAEFDFVSRFFAPGSGIDEDPVTGSAHCALTPFWSQRLQRTSLKARQLSPRGGTLDLELAGERVRIGGRAISVFSGVLAC